MDLNFTADPQVGDLDKINGKSLTQLDYAKKPQRFRFQIVYDGFGAQDIIKAVGRPMLIPESDIVDQVDLSINPSQYRVSEPTREGITQTIAGAWVDYYGLGLPKITMSGTTGWRPNAFGAKKDVGYLSNINSALKSVGSAASSLNPFSSTFNSAPGAPPPPTGLADFVYLRNRIFRTYAVLLQKLKIDFKQPVQSQLQLRFYAWDTQDYYIVLIDNFELVRSSARPMMYDYNLSMTVIGYVGNRTELVDYLAKYWTPEKRLSSILDALNRFVANAQNFENSVNSFNQSIATAIGSFSAGITQISTAVTSVVNGVSSFITFPLTATQEVVAAGRSLGNLIAQVEGIPERLRDDIHNSLLETICACYGLITYQSLFDKPFGDTFSGAPWSNLTCSSSLGIPPDPTQPDNGVPSTFNVGSVSNTGVYDPSTVQGVPVAPTNTTLSTTPYRIREVIISEGQTVESLIQSIGGLDADIAQVWQQVVTLNNLEYPYIAPNASFQSQFFATVTVNFYGTAGTVIPAGTLVSTPQVSSPGDNIIFSTSVSVTIAANGTISVLAQATGAGAYANVKAFSISQFVDISGAVITIAGVTGIENHDVASGGKIINVLRPGQKINIPVPQSSAIAETVVDRTAVIEQNLFGNDIFLTADGDFLADGQGDIATVNGIENMQAALTDRLTTDQGELIKHPGYGAPLARMIGQPGDQHALSVARLELQSTLLQDPRIKNIDNLVLSKSSDVLSVSMNLALIDETSRVTSAELPI